MPWLSPDQKRLTDWLERHAARRTPKEQEHHPVHRTEPGPAFHAARGFVLRYGIDLILQGIHDLTYWRGDTRGLLNSRHKPGIDVRCWADDIVSPARRLHAYVAELDALSRDQTDGTR